MMKNVTLLLNLNLIQVLIKMLGLAVERLETNRYMTPDEKYRNVRVVPHLLW